MHSSKENLFLRIQMFRTFFQQADKEKNYAIFFSRELITFWPNGNAGKNPYYWKLFLAEALFSKYLEIKYKSTHNTINITLAIARVKHDTMSVTLQI